MNKILFFLLWVSTFGFLFAQEVPAPVPLHRDAAWLYEKAVQDTGKRFFTAVRPFTLRDFSRQGISRDTIRSSRIAPDKDWNRAFLNFSRKNWVLRINPLLDASYFSDHWALRGNWGDIPVAGSVGLDVSMTIGRDWSLGYRRMQVFATDGYGMNRMIMKPGTNIHAAAYFNSVFFLLQLPGNGLNLNLNNNKDFYESRFTESWVAWAPHRFVQVMAGQGKHFFGEGYRSLTLSDNAYNYPYLRITTTFWKIRYTNLLGAPENITQLDNGQIRAGRKSIAVQHLEMQLSRRWYATFFESIIWERTQTGGYKTWDINYLNPAVFYHPVNYSLNSMGNALLALGLRYKAGSHTTLYGQFLIDDFNSEGLRLGNGFFQQKVGGQLGVKTFDLFRVKGLIVLAEVNMLRPYTYSNRQPGIAHAHQAQALAHPSGANLFEPLVILNYMRHGWVLELKSVFTRIGLDNYYSHNGSDILKDETLVNPYSYGNRYLQGVGYSLLRQDLRVAKVIHPASMLTAEFIVGNQIQWMRGISRNTAFVGLGVRCQFYNFYRDKI